MKKIMSYVLASMSVVFGVFMFLTAEDENLGGTVAMCACMCGALFWETLNE